MEEIGFEEEPYCTLSSAALTTGRWTRSMPNISPPSEKFHDPLTRDHFILTILTFDDW